MVFLAALFAMLVAGVLLVRVFSDKDTGRKPDRRDHLHPASGKHVQQTLTRYQNPTLQAGATDLLAIPNCLQVSQVHRLVYQGADAF